MLCLGESLKGGCEAALCAAMLVSAALAQTKNQALVTCKSAKDRAPGKSSDLFVDTLRHMVTAPVLTFEKLTA